MATAAPTLSQDALVDLLSLVKGADSVELKLTIPESSQRSTIEALGMDPLGAQVRLVYFFDTPDLTLERAGVVVRARRVAGKGDDSVVKLRPVVPSDLPSDVRESQMCMVEVEVAAESRAFLAERNLKLSGAQTTKTRKALGFFSKQLRPT